MLSLGVARLITLKDDEQHLKRIITVGIAPVSAISRFRSSL